MLAAVVVAVCAVGLLEVTPASADPAGDESEVTARVNGLRSASGIPALEVRGDLADVARAWAQQMAAAGGPSHNPALASQLVPRWATAGETVGTAADVGGVFDAFLASSLHRDTMLRPAFQAIGVGVATSGGQMFVSVVFAGDGPGTAAAPSAPAPAPAANPMSRYTAAAPAPKMVRKVVRECSRNRRGRLVCVRRIRLVPA